MNKTLLSILLVLVSILCNAQQKKQIIGIFPFASDPSNGRYEPAVYNIVTTAFTESGRFDIVDRRSMELVDKERDLQKNEEFLGGYMVAQGKSLGADYVVSGTIGGITTSQTAKYDENKRFVGYYYSATVSFSITIISVETGQVVNTQNFTGTNSANNWNIFGQAATPDVAVNQAIGSLKGKIGKKWISKVFPVKIELVKVLLQDDNKGVRSILIGAGSSYGIHDKNDVIIVDYEDVVLNGNTVSRTIELCKGKVTKVEDDNFSECKIIGDGFEVLKRLNEGKKLYIITTE